MAQVTEADYKEAQKGDAKVREEFCHQLYSENSNDSVKGVHYSELNGNFIQILIHNNSKNRSKKFRAYKPVCSGIIHIGPLAFEHFSFNLISEGIRHDGMHLEQFEKRYDPMRRVSYMAKNLKKRDIWNAVVELPVYANQIVAPLNQDLEVKEFIKNEYEGCKESFFNPSKFTERKALLEAILLGTPGDELIRRDILAS